MKVINYYKNYNYFYTGLRGLALYKGNLTILPSLMKIIITIFSLNILLEDKAISRTKKIKLKY
ncbi:hypothetical protein C8035_v008144 [Colletotrichum spinosum]|uniref:Uncharacterized protein n=1 Tax=Colletotrichum spinosum TaxID=1347390 RepID=A0A4V3HQR2_9PEZI|nr:hypothetical protein C8035_v008144 [Colletotrichum spinosum]